jgi:hypothetical protein
MNSLLTAGGALSVAAATAVWWWRNRRGLRPLSPDQAAALEAMREQMRAAGLEPLARCLNVIGTRPMPGDNAVTELGFASVGHVLILNDGFFDGNNGDPPLRTLIHEALHVYCGLLRTFADGTAVHERVYHWSDVLYEGCATGKARMPANLKAVILSNAAPVYEAPSG